MWMIRVWQGIIVCNLVFYLWSRVRFRGDWWTPETERLRNSVIAVMQMLLAFIELCMLSITVGTGLWTLIKWFIKA